MPDHVLAELEEEYGRLADEIPDSPTRQAISVLHGMVVEVWRTVQRERGGDGAGVDGRALTDLRDLFPLISAAPRLPSQGRGRAPLLGVARAGRLLRPSAVRRRRRRRDAVQHGGARPGLRPRPRRAAPGVDEAQGVHA